MHLIWPQIDQSKSYVPASHVLTHNIHFQGQETCKKGNLNLSSSLQALASNPKIDVREGKYAFKPKFHLKDKKALLRLLDKHDQLGLGGVSLDDVEEGLPNSAKAIKVIC